MPEVIKPAMDMLPAALWSQGKQRRIVSAREDAVAGDRRIALTFRADLHQDVQTFLGAVHGKLDATFVLGHDPAHDREIPLADATVLETHLEMALGFAGTSTEQEATGFAIQAVRDLRRVGPVALAKEIGERVLVIGGRRVHRKAGRLVDRENRVVLVEDTKVQRDVGLLEGRSHQHHVLARADPFTRAAPGTIGAIGTGLHDLLGSGAGEPRNPMLDKTIEALARVLGGDRERQDDRSRIATRRERSLWASRRP